MSYPETIRWSEDGRAVDVLDQTRLPEHEERRLLTSIDDVADAIRRLVVRGAPAIGIAAAMGLALDAARHTQLDKEQFLARLEHSIALLRSTRPTAVNLFWALERMDTCARENAARSNGEIACELYGEANAILREDQEMCRAIGEHGLSLIPMGARILTHCNAGALATGGMGTALAPVYMAHEAGRDIKVYADETRPLLQGSRLTVWELQRAGIDVTLIPDVVAATLMQNGQIDLVIVGADRIAANGDVANKIGTYGLAVLARHHHIPFYVAAPSSTVDYATASGADIVIEERDADEVRRGFGVLTAPADAQVFSPAFDVTPAELVTAIITDRGVLRLPQRED
ncbi:MAG TPA: S-methyl-5-thioribose-1-phosphate isomerase [Longimicrobiales bacterium]